MPGNIRAAKMNAIFPQKWLALTVFVISVLAIVIVRVRLLNFPLERDEGEYAYMGQLILEGVPPYQIACNMKMPGVYLAYAVIMSLFGETPAGIHLGLLIVNLATIVVLFFVALKFLDFYGAVIAATTYGYMVLSPAYLGLAAHATHFVILPVLLGVAAIEKSGRAFACILSGLFFGVAFIMNQPGVVFCLWGGLYLIWLAALEKRKWRQILLRAGIYSIGCAIPFLAICIWLIAAGVFTQFWFWTFTYAREYASAQSFDGALNDFLLALQGLSNSTLLPYLAAAVGLGCVCFSQELNIRARVFLAGFFALSLLAVCPGFYFRPHYFIVLAPAVALLGGVAVSWVSRWFAQEYKNPLFYHILFLLGALACAQNLYSDRAVLFSLAPNEACRAVYGLNPFPESLDIARYIEKNSRKDQRIAVMGDEPQIYFYSHRASCFRQIYPSQTMNPRPYGRKMQQEIISEIEQNPPEYLVYVSVPASWMIRPSSSPLLLAWMWSYAKTNMSPVGMIQFDDSQPDEAVWGPDAANAPLHSQFYVAVFKQNPK